MEKVLLSTTLLTLISLTSLSLVMSDPTLGTPYGVILKVSELEVNTLRQKHSRFADLMERILTGGSLCSWDVCPSCVVLTYLVTNLWATEKSLHATANVNNFAVTTEKASAKCPDSWVMFGNSCYLFIAKITRWYDAQIICKSVDSSLVKIESPEENEFVFRLARNHRKTVWIGLIDLVQEGHFVWADTQRVSTYTRWSQGNPDNFEGEDCAALWFDREGFWNDYNCDTRLAAICEKHSTL